jgi:hypothetical protein
MDAGEEDFPCAGEVRVQAGVLLAEGPDSEHSDLGHRRHAPRIEAARAVLKRKVAAKE